jgi:Protein of unknown function (DUF2442)
MQHPIYRVESFEQIAPHTLRIRFNDGLSRVIDFEPVLHGELFGPLRDPNEFARVKIDSEVGTLVWASGADFDPAILHDWPEHENSFRRAAEKWQTPAEAR